MLSGIYRDDPAVFRTALQGVSAFWQFRICDFNSFIFFSLLIIIKFVAPNPAPANLGACPIRIYITCMEVSARLLEHAYYFQTRSLLPS